MKVCTYDSPAGRIYITGDGLELYEVTFTKPENFYPDSDPDKNLQSPVFVSTKRWLDLYFQGMEPDFLPRLHMEGPAFSREIWQRLLQIPYGKTVSYGQIAREYEKDHGRRMSAQAVGQAVGRNPFCILIPCHRVVGKDGSLTGYACGLEYKKALLGHEESWNG